MLLSHGGPVFVLMIIIISANCGGNIYCGSDVCGGKRNHVMCKNEKTLCSPLNCAKEWSGMSDDWRTKLLQAVNKARLDNKGANMHHLKWSFELEMFAQCHATASCLNYKNDECRDMVQQERLSAAQITHHSMSLGDDAIGEAVEYLQTRASCDADAMAYNFHDAKYVGCSLSESDELVFSLLVCNVAPAPKKGQELCSVTAGAARCPEKQGNDLCDDPPTEFTETDRKFGKRPASMKTFLCNRDGKVEELQNFYYTPDDS